MRPQPTGDPERDEYERRLWLAREADAQDRWHTQLATSEGRAFLWTCVLRTLPGYQDIHGDLAFVYRELGRRAVWLELLTAIDAHAEFAQQMQQEGMKRDRALVAGVTAKWQDWLKAQRAGGTLV